MRFIKTAIVAGVGAVLLGGTALANEPMKLGNDQLDKVTAGFMLDLRLALSEAFGEAAGGSGAESSSSTESSDTQNTDLQQDENSLSLQVTDELVTNGQSSASATGPGSAAATGSSSAAGKLIMQIPNGAP